MVGRTVQAHGQAGPVPSSHARDRARGRLVVVVTHRLSAACVADRIIVLSRGQLVEQGSQ
jgi:ABC-type transport system involved in Fe-S cluster assembly fused permease/ATPase subunit